MERLKAAVIDSSVLLKWFRPHEPHAEASLAMRQDFLDGRLELAVPDLAFYEIANVLRYRASESIAVQAVESLFDLRIPLYRVDSRTLRMAIQAAVRHQITVYDAAFLAVAEQIHYQLVTADKQFYQAVRKSRDVFFLGC